MFPPVSGGSNDKAAGCSRGFFEATVCFSGEFGRKMSCDNAVCPPGYVHHLDLLHDYPAPEFPVMTIPREAWRNGLVLRMPNHLGDAVMALPALQMLRRIVPEYCSLQVIAPVGQRALYGSLPDVDVFLPLAEIHRGWSIEELLSLRQQRLGIGVLFNNSLRDALLMRLAGVPRLFGAAARGRSPLLARSFRFPPRRDRQLAEIHQTNKCLAIASALGAPRWDGSLPVFRLRPAVNELAPEITAFCEHPRMLTVASGAAYGAAKRWPGESFREVAGAWVEGGGIVVVLGSASERAVGNEVISGLRRDRAFNLSGKTGLAELMHLLAGSVLTVANDSGIMHLSAALGRPGVAIFGPTDYTATGPISSKWSLLFDKVECAPCFRRECPQGEARCIRRVTPGMVIAEMRRIAGAEGIRL